ncbi:MAG: Uma2 family endonuclease [Candidatus Promineifilaceae bacterium]
MVALKGKTAEKQSYITYEEYLTLAGEAQITEWVDGEVITYMPPFYTHQDIVTFLAAILREFVSILQLGEIIIAPFEVKLWTEGPSREPDLFFVGKANLTDLTDRRFEGGPDLVVEVISADSVRRDRVDKFQEYEQAGVKEYWLIDPRTNRQQADFYERDETGLFVPAELDENGVFHSAVLPGFWLNVNWFWEEPLPNPQFLLAQLFMTSESISPEIRLAYHALYEALKKE